MIDVEDQILADIQYALENSQPPEPVAVMVPVRPTRLDDAIKEALNLQQEQLIFILHEAA